MNIAISPVKIVQEEPFIFEAISGSLPTSGPATTSVSVARKIKFSDTTAVTAAEKETATTSADKNILATPLLTNGHAQEQSEIAKCSSGSSEEKSSVATSDDEDVIESSQSSSNESADSKRQQRKRKIGNTTDADKSASVTKRTGDFKI